CITVVDAQLCGITDCITVEANPPGVEVSVNDVTCPGGTDGSLSASPSGGTPPYTYTWSNGQTGPNIVGLTAGTYTVTLTDASGCTDVASGTVTQPPAIMVAISTSGDVCTGDSDATATATATGGTPPFTYSWSTGANGPTITGLGSGTYTVTATDANGCPKTGTVTIQTFPSPTVSIQGPDIICGAGNSGTLTAVGAGGAPGYLYNWSTGAVTASITVGTSGTYSVTITDQNGCTASTSKTVTVIDDLVINLTSTNISCNGGNDGTATVTVTGGSMPYTYMWSTGATTPTITGLGTGTYTVTVTEGNGCKAIGNVTITQPPMISKSVEVTDVTCFGGSDGAIDVMVSGGTIPYSYNWSTGATTQDLTGLMAGLYSITVTDANGCMMSILNIVVEQSPQINLTISGTDVDCNGAATGSVDLGVSGGTPPFTYNWSNGATTQDLSNVVAGTYSVTVTDVFECDATISITINQPAALSITGTVTNLDCFGDEDGSIDITVTGGTAPYIYSYSNGSTSQDISGLVAGTYTVTVTDANGCTDEASFTITQPTELVATGTTVNV
ncbi:MAG: SprB repeat-containing protein, partial [Saprospiraceae bacterium]